MAGIGRKPNEHQRTPCAARPLRSSCLPSCQKVTGASTRSSSHQQTDPFQSLSQNRSVRRAYLCSHCVRVPQRSRAHSMAAAVSEYEKMTWTAARTSSYEEIHPCQSLPQSWSVKRAHMCPDCIHVPHSGPLISVAADYEKIPLPFVQISSYEKAHPFQRLSQDWGMKTASFGPHRIGATERESILGVLGTHPGVRNQPRGSSQRRSPRLRKLCTFPPVPTTAHAACNQPL